MRDGELAEGGYGEQQPQRPLSDVEDNQLSQSKKTREERHCGLLP